MWSLIYHLYSKQKCNNSQTIIGYFLGTKFQKEKHECSSCPGFSFQFSHLWGLQRNNCYNISCTILKLCFQKLIHQVKLFLPMLLCVTHYYAHAMFDDDDIDVRGLLHSIEGGFDSFSHPKLQKAKFRGLECSLFLHSNINQYSFDWCFKSLCHLAIHNFLL